MIDWFDSAFLLFIFCFLYRSCHRQLLIFLWVLFLLCIFSFLGPWSFGCDIEYMKNISWNERQWSKSTQKMLKFENKSLCKKGDSNINKIEQWQKFLTNNYFLKICYYNCLVCTNSTIVIKPLNKITSAYFKLKHCFYFLINHLNRCE